MAETYQALRRRLLAERRARETYRNRNKRERAARPPKFTK